MALIIIFPEWSDDLDFFDDSGKSDPYLDSNNAICPANAVIQTVSYLVPMTTLLVVIWRPFVYIEY